ncbi:S-layer homology domain-containing protein [Cohnella sp. AR92]|uniref:S-layer homology domain-containing protein n=1 Tax=Cohnella sp. AR92 TaxID=648716 RepID=UPI000F8D7E14|nr:S-layer homology domain-containing protein [Cohnella sp. AR92]RUS47126.1 DUF4430 domain-containing protein [Cohnella sp. AR92]
MKIKKTLYGLLAFVLFITLFAANVGVAPSRAFAAEDGLQASIGRSEDASSLEEPSNVEDPNASKEPSSLEEPNQSEDPGSLNALSDSEELASPDAVSEQLEKNLAKILADVPNPTFSTSGGEWSVLSLARAGYSVPANYYEIYRKNVVNSVKNLMNANGGVLDKNRSTEHSRLIIGFASAGLDPRYVAGYDITQALSDYDYIVKQGINGPIFALIAMDTLQFEFPQAAEGKTQASREKLLAYLLSKEIKAGTAQAGGWALGTSAADVDLTAMTLQALAPYYDSNENVRAAVDRAVTWLSNAQNSTGGFASYGTVSSESIAQVITALSELGIDSATDPRFVKNGISAIDALLSFAVPTGGFKHVLTGAANGMATDQGTYALVAYERMKQGQTRLYEMTDTGINAGGPVQINLPDEDPASIEIPADHRSYRILVSAADSSRTIKVAIPDDSDSAVSFKLPFGSKLPGIEAVKGSVSVLLPRNSEVTRGDSSELEWLTKLDPASDALKSTIGKIVEKGRSLDSISQAFSMGGTDRVEFDSYVTLTFSGMKGKSAAYIESGSAHPIARFASDSEGIESGLDEYAYDSGPDLIVKTNHFTDYVAYSTAAVNSGGGTGGGQASTGKITLSIDKNTIGKGYVLDPASVELYGGDTVWSVLQRELDARNIEYSYAWTDKYDSVYLQSIAGDGEFDHGSGSGWMYSVNGKYPNYGASNYTLKNGDRVQWRYTTNLGEDLGQDPGKRPMDGGSEGAEEGDVVVKLPTEQQQDFVLDVLYPDKSSGKIYYDIPATSPFKFFINLKAVKAAIPNLIVTRGDYKLAIDYGTQLKAGGETLEMFADAANADKLAGLVKESLSEGRELKGIVHSFSMGSDNDSFVFDRPVTLTIAGAKDQLAGFVENGKFTPITIYKSDEQGAYATAGQEKFAYAYADGNDLIVKTNHFTTYLTYGIAAPATEDFDLKKQYSDAASVSSWAFDSMSKAASQGFVQGSGGKLSPQASITKAEFAKLLVSVLGIAASETKTNGFTDVTEDKWFYAYVNTAQQAGFVSGYGDKFNPNDRITREQMASILSRALDLESATAAESLKDMDQVSAWAKSDVQKILSLQIMKGQGDRFAPKDSVTREMAIVVAMRAYDYRNEHKADEGSTAEDLRNKVQKLIPMTAAYMQKTIADPIVGSIGGEWTVFGLSRSGVQVPESYYDKYIENLNKTLKDKLGNLHSVKYTEYDRVILALSALGKSVTDAAGYNLLDKLADYETLIKQGINGPIFALIALDSRNYEIPAVTGVKTQTTRELLIDFILKREVAGGGWALGANAKESDPDITSMALQALAPYYDTNEKVHAAVDRGVAWLSKAQLADGSFAISQTVNSESIAQVIVALTSLGIDPAADARFVKNGHSALEALLSFAAPEGGFYHVKTGGVANGGASPGNTDAMATDQAMYALVAYERFAEGLPRLYDLTDVK